MDEGEAEAREQICFHFARGYYLQCCQMLPNLGRDTSRTNTGLTRSSSLVQSLSRHTGKEPVKEEHRLAEAEKLDW